MTWRGTPVVNAIVECLFLTASSRNRYYREPRVSCSRP